MDLQYHPGKANVVADALSRKAHCNALRQKLHQPELTRELRHLNLHIVRQGTTNTLVVQPNLEEQIGQAQKEDPYLTTMKNITGKGKAPGFRVDEMGIL